MVASQLYSYVSLCMYRQDQICIMGLQTYQETGKRKRVGHLMPQHIMVISYQMKYSGNKSKFKFKLNAWLHTQLAIAIKLQLQLQLYSYSCIAIAIAIAVQLQLQLYSFSYLNWLYYLINFLSNSQAIAKQLQQLRCYSYMKYSIVVR